MKSHGIHSDPSESQARRGLRIGFSTGSAMTAAALAALRHGMTGAAPKVVAVRLPAGYFLPVPVDDSGMEGEVAWAKVIKDGGDDPDVTHRAEVRVAVRRVAPPAPGADGECGRGGSTPPWCGDGPDGPRSGVCLAAGEGVGMVTKPGLPVAMGEPAINPVPRLMLAQNLAEELLRRHGAAGTYRTAPMPDDGPGPHQGGGCPATKAAVSPTAPRVFVPFDDPEGHLDGIYLQVDVIVPDGKRLARSTLNPRLGILGGISILGTTGIVRPFSHEAYEATIRAALSVAASNGCREVVLSTGGKSEKLAAKALPGRPPEAFVQIADFFAFAVEEARRRGFERIVHSVFFGKAVKMAQGHAYTHAHTVPLELGPVARLAAERGVAGGLCRELAQANTARHALELLAAAGAFDVARAVAGQALMESARIAGDGVDVRLLLFDYDGSLLWDSEK